MTRIGFVGLGRMGLPMATNLVDAGHEVAGFDLDEGRVESFAAAGGTAADSAEAAVADAEVVITIVRTPEQVEAIADAVLPAMTPGTVYVDMSSIDPLTAREVAERAADRDVRAVDAPVSGGVVGAEEGTLSIMVGGDEDDVDAVRPVFEVLGAEVFHVGESGAGQTVKLANQLSVGVQCAILSEVFHFGEAAGIDPEILLAVLRRSAGRTGVLEIKGEKLVERDFEPGFDVALQAKDLRLGLEAAAAFDVPMPAAASAFQTFVAARRAGLGDRDHLAVYELQDG